MTKPKPAEALLQVHAPHGGSWIADPETGELIKRYTFTLIIRGANALMRAIHNSGENEHHAAFFTSGIV